VKEGRHQPAAAAWGVRVLAEEGREAVVFLLLLTMLLLFLLLLFFLLAPALAPFLFFVVVVAVVVLHAWCSCMCAVMWERVRRRHDEGDEVRRRIVEEGVFSSLPVDGVVLAVLRLPVYCLCELGRE